MSVDAAANVMPAQSGPSNEERHQAALKAWRRLTMVVLLMTASPVFGSVLVGLRVHHTRHAPSPIIPRPDTTFVSIHAKLQSVALQLEITQTQQAIHQLHAVETEWNKLVDATLHDDLGKRIAGTDATLLRFWALQQMQPPQRQNRDFSNRLAEIESKVDLPQEGRPSRQLASEATELKQDVLALLTFHQGRVQALSDLRHQATQLPLAGSELKEVLQTRNSQLESHRQSLATAAAAELSKVMQRDLDELETQRAEVDTLVNELRAQFTLVERGEEAAGFLSSSATFDNQNYLHLKALSIRLQTETGVGPDVFPFQKHLSPEITRAALAALSKDVPGLEASLAKLIARGRRIQKVPAGHGQPARGYGELALIHAGWGNLDKDRDARRTAESLIAQENGRSEVKLLLAAADALVGEAVRRNMRMHGCPMQRQRTNPECEAGDRSFRERFDLVKLSNRWRWG